MWTAVLIIDGTLIHAMTLLCESQPMPAGPVRIAPFRGLASIPVCWVPQKYGAATIKRQTERYNRIQTKLRKQRSGAMPNLNREMETPTAGRNWESSHNAIARTAVAEAYASTQRWNC